MRKLQKYLILIFILSLNFSCGQFGNSNSNNKNTRKTKKEEMKKEISIIGVGDIMLGSNYPSEELLPNTNILQDVEGILKDADITTGNLEGTLFDKGGDAKTCDNPSVCYVFRMPSKYGEYLKNAGFDYLSLANNHSNDFGETGISQTMKNLDGLGIKYSGIKDKIEYSILEKDGIKYGFVSFAPNSKTVDINDYEYASKLIKSLKSKTNIVVVYFHGGAEGKDHEHITRNNEIFHDENRGNVFKFARSAVDSGADIVFGQGPHVTRAIELYKNKFISYSAGNFATFGNITLSGISGIAPIFKIKLDNNGNFISGKIISVKQEKGVPKVKIDSENTATKRIITLSNQDFPEGNGLRILETGEIERK
nr:CapA family protein [uncultured Leptotrichia sp.]